MTIFDYMPTTTEPDFHDMTEAEMVDYVGKVLGVTFVRNDRLNQWEYLVNKKRKFKLELEYGHYRTIDHRDGTLYVGVGYSYTYGGGVCPCDSLESAINYLKMHMERALNGYYEPKPSEEYYTEDDE